MNTLTLLFIIFFTFYGGIGSKIKHKKADKIARFFDQKSLSFIKTFALKTNKELIPIIEKKNEKFLIILFFVLLFMMPFKLKTGYYLAVVFCVFLFMTWPLTSPKSLKKQLIKITKQLFAITSIILLVYIAIEYAGYENEDTFIIKHEFSKITDTFQLNADLLGVDLSTYVVIIILSLILIGFFYLALYISSRIILWVSLFPLKYYARICFVLNKRQPLKPFYLLSSIIVLVMTHLV